jgi:hypothetical protein
MPGLPLEKLFLLKPSCIIGGQDHQVKIVGYYFVRMDYVFRVVGPIFSKKVRENPANGG